MRRARDIDLEWIVRNMVGENFDLGSPPTGYAIGDVALSVEDLSVPDAGGRRAFGASTACRSTCAPARSSASTA